MRTEPLFPYEYWGISSFLPAASQMALEDYFRQYVARANEKPDNRTALIRFFSLPYDTVILGYGQDTDVLKRDGKFFDVSRRITGGAHIQVGIESLAYSIVIPRDGTFYNWREMRKYYADAIARALSKLGIAPIETSNELANITVKGRIISSHSSWWGVRSAFVHGLVLLYPYDVDKIAERMVLLRRKIGRYFYSEYRALKKLPAVSKELEKRLVRSLLTPDKLREIVADAILQEITGGRFKKRVITHNVMDDIAPMVREKYGTVRWIEGRKPPFTKEEVEEIEGTSGLNDPLSKGVGYCLFYGVSDDDFKIMAEPEED